MKVLKTVLSVILILSGLGWLAQGQTLPSVLLVISGCMVLPAISNKFKENPFWKLKASRVVLPIAFFSVAITMIEIPDSTDVNSTEAIKRSGVDFTSYLNAMKKAQESLDVKKMERRQKILKDLRETRAFIALSDSQIVKVEFLPILTIINDGLTRLTSDQFAINEGLMQSLGSATTFNDESAFVVKTLALALPQENGGLPNEILEIFERYRKRYNLYGAEGSTFYGTGNKETVFYNFDMTAFFVLMEKNNKDFLNAFYKARQNGISNWKEGSDFLYPFLASQDAFNSHLGEVYPKSEYYRNYDERLTAQELFHAYEGNEISADDRFKNRRLAVTGKVKEIRETLGDIYIDLYSGDPSGWTVISCQMSNRDEVTRLAKGQRIRLIGKCTGKTLNVSIDLIECGMW